MMRKDDDRSTRKITIKFYLKKIISLYQNLNISRIDKE